MRKVLYLLSCCALFAQLNAQTPPFNDLCVNALQLELSSPASCPGGGVTIDTFTFSNLGATSTSPYPFAYGCSGNSPLAQESAEVWFRLRPNGNTLRIAVQGGLNTPNLILFEGASCSNFLPVACAAGDGLVTLEANVDADGDYYLMVAGGSPDDQGDFQLIIRTINDCFPCTYERRGYFSISPALENGLLSGSGPVQMCYTVTRWNASATGELLHALELEFGDGWDRATFEPLPPASCSPNGQWSWYNSWLSSATGRSFGPGFAYDGSEFGNQDGNPGNNRGMGGPNCSNIGISGPSISFCWTIAPNECQVDGEYGYQGNLRVNVRMLGDGASGSWGYSTCTDGTSDQFLAAQYCPDPLAPNVIAIDAACANTCDGAITITGGGEGPWDYTVFDASGNIIYESYFSTATDTVAALCTGIYEVKIFSHALGQSRSVQVTINAGAAPQVFAYYKLPCIAGEAIELYGQASPSNGVQYQWTGPNGFSSTNQNPMALHPGQYTLVATLNGCASEPFLLEVPPLEDNVVASIAQDTISACPGETVTLTASGNALTFNWYNLETFELIGTGPSISVEPVDGAAYRVTGMSEAGCFGFDDVVILVPFSPVIESSATGIICPGEEVSISVSLGETFAWSTGDTTSAITVSPASNETYHVTVTAANGCVFNLAATVFVSSPSSLFISPPVALCQGETISLFASGGLVEWSTGEQGSTIVVAPDTTTVYTATILDNNGCLHERTTTVTVSPAVELNLSPEGAIEICEGEAVSLQAFIADTLFWDTLVAPLQSTLYLVPGASDLGCLSLGSFDLTVRPLPQLEIQGGGLACSADSILLTALSDGDLLWSTGDTSSAIYVTPTGNEVYTVTATNEFGCQQQDSVEVLQTAAPAAPIVDCQTSLGQVLFSWAFDPDISYSILVSSNPIGAFLGNNQYVVSGLSPGQSVTIELTAENAEGCTATTIATCSALPCSALELILEAPDAACLGAGSIPLSASVTNGGSSGIGAWSGLGVNAATATFDPQAAGAGLHELVYTYAESSCILSDTLSIMVEQPLEAALVECSASPSSVAFTWPQLPQDTAYAVEVLTGQSGSFTGPTTFVVDSLAVGDSVLVAITALGGGACGEVTVLAACVTLSCQPLEMPVDTFICGGGSVVLEVDPLGWDSFQWSPAGSLSCADCPNPLAKPLVTTVYTLIARNSAGCADTAKVTVYVNEIPPSYLPDQPIYFCEGETIEICLPDGDVYLWVGINSFVSQSQCLRIENITANQAGPYYGLLWINGCRITKRIELRAAPPVEIDAMTEFVRACPDSTFTLAVESPNAVSYQWSPGEYLECPDCPITEGSVAQTTIFNLELTNAYGCSENKLAFVYVDANNCSVQPLISSPSSNEEPAAAERQNAVSPSAFRFFPNPASTELQIVLPAEGEKVVQLLNTSGAMVKNLRTAQETLQLDVQGLPNGSYLLRVIADGEVYTGWLVVAR